MEANKDLRVSYLDVGWGVNDISEDVPCLCITVSSHSTGQASIESAGDDEESHVKVHLHTDGRGEGIHVEEANRIGEGVFDQHALSVSGNQVFGALGVVGEENGGLVVAKVLNVNLPEGTALNHDWLFIYPRGAILASGHIKGEGTPCRRWESTDFCKQSR